VLRPHTAGLSPRSVRRRGPACGAPDGAPADKEQDGGYLARVPPEAVGRRGSLLRLPYLPLIINITTGINKSCSSYLSLDEGDIASSYIV